MFGSIKESGATGGKILFDIDRNGRALTVAEIIAPDVARFLKNDCAFPDRRELNIEVLEGGELFGLLTRQVDRVKIHPPIAIGNEIDTIVRAPHRADILGRVIR